MPAKTNRPRSRSRSRSRSHPRRATIVIVGSVNMDLVMQLPRLPAAGETLAAASFQTLPGGKGANQAVAIARLGGRALLVGCIGDDPFGAHLRDGLRRQGVDTRHLKTQPGTSSGVAFIGIDPAGQNSIAIASGANGRLRPADLRAIEQTIAQADALLVQLEIPLPTAAAAIRLARRHGVPTILDVAPVPPGGLPASFPKVDILSPNQSETELLTAQPCQNLAAARAAADGLLRRYDPGLAIIKLGELGALAHVGASAAPLHMPAFPIAAKDTTAAGDAFTAALTLRLAEGANLGEALRFACGAGALAATRLGAQNAMPSRQELDRFLRQRPTRPAPIP